MSKELKRAMEVIAGLPVTKSRTWQCSRCGSASANACIELGCAACEVSVTATTSTEWWEQFKLDHSEWQYADRDAIVKAAYEAGAASRPAATPVKDHVLRDVVNNLRDTAVKYGATQQLRERLKEAIKPLIGFGVVYASPHAHFKAIGEVIDKQLDLPVQPPQEQLQAVQEVVLGYMSDSHGLEQGADDTLRITEAFLEAAKQPYTTASDKYRAELYDEVWAKARAMGFENVTMALNHVTALDANSTRWNKVLGSIRAERDPLEQRKRYYFLFSGVVGHVPKDVNPMKGSVAGHFTQHIDNLIKTPGSAF